MRFVNNVDEAGVERLEHLLWPFWFGINNSSMAQQYRNLTNTNYTYTSAVNYCADNTDTEQNHLKYGSVVDAPHAIVC